MSMLSETLAQVPWYRVTIGCNTFIFLLELYLDYRQISRLKKYGLTKQSFFQLDFSRVESTFGFLFECIVLMLGTLVLVWDKTTNQLESLGFGKEYQIVYGVSYLFVVSFFSSLVRAPFEIFRVVFLEKHVKSRWGTLLRMAADQIGIFFISLIAGAPLLAVTLSLLYWDFQFQWLVTCIFVCAVAVLFSDMYAVMLAPMFNKYTRLPDGVLRAEILELSRKLKFPVKDVYTMDGSKRSAHSNAFLMGFWSSSVVLYDTLVKDLSTPEILAILGHEIGHHKFNHTWKHLFMQLVFVGNFIFLFSRVVSLPEFYASFGFSVADAGIGLVLFSYLYSTFANFLKFVTNLFRRRFEYEADAYALSLGLDLRRALVHMHGATNNVLPDPFYSVYHFAHPSLSERLAWMDHYTILKKAPPASPATSDNPKKEM
eukprot:Phypoly_transcript_07711.p1 GENE.Phypoly_transcript_07711~~Phypoly_transcript_07711.p1  ORF type:complete len:428 (+),score=23.67 Phypoly_transcript_07711:127-1410(+)